MPSELSPCGLTHATYDYLRKIGYDEELIFASFLFLRTGGHYDTVADHLTAKFGRGWSESTCRAKIPEFFETLYRELQGNWLVFRDDILLHEANTTDDFFSKDILLALDTVPIYVRSADRCFQPKYADHVVKAAVGCTFSGYVCFFPENLYTGSTPDNNILEHTKITDILKIHKIRCLADGGFKGCSEVIRPFTKTQIWPLKRLLGQTEQDYEDQADKKLEFNEMVAHYRSRVEHLFSSSNGVGRWTAFKHWNKDLNCTLFYAFGSCLIVQNVEMFLRHREKGKYKPINEAGKALLVKKFKEHKAMSSRYPNPTTRSPCAEFQSTIPTYFSRKRNVENNTQ